MDQQNNDPTVLKAKSSSGSEDETVVHSEELDEETRLAGTSSSLPSNEQNLDPPTRLMVASARRLQQKSNFSTGTLIRNRFRLEDEIGRGGMGMVFTARDLRKEEVGDKDSLIAIKLLSEDFKDHPESLRMLQQETRKTQKLAHPNIVTVYDFDRDGDDVYMTMEYLSGYPLTDFIKEREHTPSSLEEVLPIISDIVNGLSYAHKQGIIHSDLKPGNIFLTDDNVTKILDFGIARAVMVTEESGSDTQKSNGDVSHKQSSETKTEPEKLFALTPRYASPEMFEDAEPDPRDDIYALACIAYQLLSGQHPFDGLPANKAMSEGFTPEPIAGLTDRQWKGLLAGLAFDRDARTSNAEDLLEAFLPKRKEPWRWATAAAGLLAIGIATYYGTKPPKEAPLSEQEQTIVNQQIEIAKQHMDVGNLGLALENYKMILALPPYDQNHPGGDFIQHPFNSEATEDLKILVGKITEQAQSAFEEQRTDDALAFIEAGLNVDAENSTLTNLKEEIVGSK